MEIFCILFLQTQNVLNFLLFDYPNFSDKIYQHHNLFSHGIMMLKMIWHVKQEVANC